MGDAAPTIRFRNYVPLAASASGARKAPDASSGVVESKEEAAAPATTLPGVEVLPRTLAPSIAKKRELDAEDAARIAEAPTDDVARIVPRKANWDLKRDIAPKLAVLNARTQEAIHDLVRARAQEQHAAGVAGVAGDVDLARLVASHNGGADEVEAPTRDAAELDIDDV